MTPEWLLSWMARCVRPRRTSAERIMLADASTPNTCALARRLHRQGRIRAEPAMHVHLRCYVYLHMRGEEQHPARHSRACLSEDGGQLKARPARATAVVQRAGSSPLPREVPKRLAVPIVERTAQPWRRHGQAAERPTARTAPLQQQNTTSGKALPHLLQPHWRSQVQSARGAKRQVCLQ